MSSSKLVLKSVSAAVLAVAMTGTAAQAELIYGLTTDNNIFSFDSATPGTILSGHFISGLQVNEGLVGIDIRPSTGVIYSVSTFGNIYTVNPSTGGASLVAPITGTALNGTSFDIDFNPAVDAIRLVSDADQNLAINPVTGVATVQSALNASYGNPNISGAAYTTAATLYTIDTGVSALGGPDVLNIQTPPASGTQTATVNLTDGASTPADLTGLLGFDISNGTGAAYLALQFGVNGYSQFGSLNLATGKISGAVAAAPSSGLIGSGLFVRDITVAVPEPTTLAGLGLAAAGLLARRRKA